MSETYSIEAVLKAKVTDFVNGFKQAHSAANDFVKKNEKTFDSFKQVGKAATAGGLAIGAGLGGAVKIAADFEAQISKVGAISGASSKDMKSLATKAREVGASTKFSAAESAQAFEYMALAGWKTTDMLDGIDGMMSLAAASGEDLALMSDIVTDGLSMFGMEAKESARFADVMAAAAANTNTNVGGMGESLKYVGASANAAGLSIEETSAFIGMLANNGIKGSAAGTAMNAVLRDMKKKSDNGAIAIGKTAVAIYDSEGKMRSLSDVMADVEKATDGMTDAQRDAALMAVFGDEALRGVNIALSSGSDELKRLEGVMNDAEGTAAGMAEVMQDNLAGAVTNLKSGLEEMAIAIGTALLPAVKLMVKFIQSLVDKFNSLDDSTKTIIAVIATLSAGFLLLVGPLLLFIGFIPSILAGFTHLATVMSVVGKAIAAVNWPITLLVVALIAAAALVYKYWEPIGNFFEYLGKQIAQAFEQVKAVAVSAVDKIVEVAQSVGGIFTSAFENVVKILGKLKESLSIVKDFFSLEKATTSLMNALTLLGGALTVVKDFFMLEEAVAALKKGMSLLGESLTIVKDFFSLEEAVTALKNGVALLGGALLSLLGPWGLLASILLKVVTQTTLVQDAFKVLKGEMSIEELVSNLVKSFDDVVSGAAEMASQFIKIGTQMVLSLIKGFVDNIDEIIGGIRDVTATITSTLLSLLPQLIVLGTELIVSLVNGLVEAIPMVVQVITDLIPLIIGTLADSIVLIIGVGVDLITALVDGIVTALPFIVEIALSIITTVVETIVSLIPVIVEVGLNIIQALLDGILTALPMVIEIAIDLILLLVDGIITALPIIIETGITVLMTLIDAIISALPMIIEIGITVLMTLIDAIISALPIIIEAGITVLMTLIDGIISAIPVIIETGISILMTLIDAMITVLPLLVGAAILIILSLVDALISALPKIIEAGIQLIMGLIDGIISVLPQLIDAGIELILALAEVIIKLVPALLSAGIQLIVALVKGVLSILGQLLAAGAQLISGLLSKILSFVGQMLSAGKDLIVKLVSGIISMLSKVIKSGADLIKPLINKIGTFATDMLSVGKDLVQGLINGIKNMTGKAVEAVTGVVNGVVKKAKSLLGIKSPSRVFMKFGGFISEGAAIGIENMKEKAIKASEALGLGIENAFDPRLAMQRLDISEQVDSINRQASRSFDNEFNANMSVQKQPAVINIHVGSRLIAQEIVDDVTGIQNMKKYSSKKARRR